MREVKLWDMSGAALIVPEETGVIFTNQVNGTACDHPKLEGILIPINNDCLPENHENLLETKLCALFDGAWDAITDEKANEIDLVLSSFRETESIAVDRSKIAQSVESWLYVIANETEFSCFSGFGEIRGILTWQNSD